MKMTTEEIERLLRVVSQPLRQSWEIRKFNSRSLLDAKRSRQEILSTSAIYGKNIPLWGKITIVLSVLFFALTFLYRWSFLGIPIVIVPSFCLLNRYEKKLREMNKVFEQNNNAFENFKESVDALNPLGTGNSYHDAITEPEVVERLTRLAYRIMDAEQNFDTARMRSISTRHDVIHLGNWVEKCQVLFDQVWDVAKNDFGLELDKPAIFKKAAEQLARNKPKDI